ncbi:MAG: ATP-binding protein [Paracoccaceae bacterium]
MPDDPLFPRGSPDAVQIVIPADPQSVRGALCALFDSLLLQSLSEDRRGTAEIVLAEAMNNIVEHAYARREGLIHLSLRLGPCDLVCRIEDSGQPMPAGELPGRELCLRDETGDVAEGGFGWHLIRSLSRDLDYRRVDGRNLLTFRIDAGQSRD